MKFVRRLATSSAGFAIGLTLLVSLFLIGVGLGSNALPYPPWQVSPASQIGVVPPGWPFSDAIISHWPAALFLQRAMRLGVWPLWRSLLMSGQPFAANPLNKVWYPPQWLVVLFPVTLHLNLLIGGHLVLAGLGMRALAQRLGLSTLTASIMAVAYTFTPRLAAATGAGHLDIVYATAWFPWLLWAVHHAITQPGPLVRHSALLGVIGAFCFIADIRLSLFIFATAAVLGIVWWWQISPSQRRSALIAVGLGGVLTLGLTAVQWIPLLELAPYLSRGGMTTQDAGVFSLQPIALIGMLWPNRGGQHETMVYVGVGVLVLAIWGFVQSLRRHAVWGAIALTAAFYSFGSEAPFWPILVRLVPPLLWFRVPSRAWIVVVVALIILAGYGLDALLASRERRASSLFGVVLLGLGFAFGSVGAFLPLRPGASLAAAVGLCGLGILILVKRRLTAATFPIAVCLLVVIDLIWMDISLVAGLPQSIWLDSYQPTAQALLDAGVTRLYSPDYSLPQEVAAYWNIPDFGGVDPFQLRAYVGAFEAATGIRAAGYSVTLPAFNSGDLLSANRDIPVNATALAQWNVSHVLSRFPIQAEGLHLVQRINDLYLYENTLRSTAISINWEGPNRFTATNHGDRPVNVSAGAVGWGTSESNTAIAVQPGQTVTQQYESPGLLLAVALSAISLAAIGAIFVITATTRTFSANHLAA